LSHVWDGRLSSFINADFLRDIANDFLVILLVFFFRFRPHGKTEHSHVLVMQLGLRIFRVWILVHPTWNLLDILVGNIFDGSYQLFSRDINCPNIIVFDIKNFAL
jgi:hypothetical protein